MIENPLIALIGNIPLRACAAFFTAFLMWIILGGRYIQFLTSKQMGQTIRAEGPASHQEKKGTPTMGGGLIVFAITVASLVWCDWTNLSLWLILGVLITTALVGWWDDYLKVALKHNRGLASRKKFLAQSFIAVVSCVIFYYFSPSEPYGLTIPGLADTVIPLGLLWFVLGYFVITGTSNAVNLTDGLDGLAGGVTVVVSLGLAITAYTVGDPFLSEAYQIHFVPETKELSVLAATIMGACLGFLWFNAPKAMVFMGDVGSLALGAALGMLAIALQQELLLLVMGAVYVMETVSVILQVSYFKLTKGRRIFKMSPIHHHFELSGWPQTRVVVRFWILSCLFVVLGLTLLFSRA